MQKSETARRRLNIMLSENTIAMIDRLTGKGNRSRFIQQAVEYYVGSIGRQKLRKFLIEGGKQRAERDRSVAAEWFAFDKDSWERDSL